MCCVKPKHDRGRELGRMLSEKFFENKKLFWKEVKREREEILKIFKA